ncbi:MAG: hypothetical protein HUK00_04535 [Bacteroidaceae bacterium]|nr:hypothetical protein [Bacteroidaceae bacterium]
MTKKDLTIQHTHVQSETLDVLAQRIHELVQWSKETVARQINTTIVQTYWEIGRHIVEFEQKGNASAQYGSQLLSELAKRLTALLGKGYSKPNLYNMRRFYLVYPNFQTVSIKLSWSHICELIAIDDEVERQFYEKACIQEKWSVRDLKRQKETSLFLRLAASRDKEGILQLASKGMSYSKPEDIIKDTYTLEFVDNQSETSKIPSNVDFFSVKYRF